MLVSFSAFWIQNYHYNVICIQSRIELGKQDAGYIL
jgi:hypothetical protein